ncbi:MAG: di-heme oxidoredictase family protein [Myxococcota bacterium]
MTRLASFGGLLVVLLLGACRGEEGRAEPGDIFAPMGEPVPFATAEQLAAFERGEQVARHRFTPETGLGPHFNVTFCGGCHEKPVFGGAGGRYRNFLLVGQRLSDDSFVPTGVNGIQTQYTLASTQRQVDAPDTNVHATRNPIPFFGVGLLAAVPEEEILKHADEDDRDGDGISGRPNLDRGFVGRFGRKAQTVSIEGFIRGPLFNHMGVTSDPLPDVRKARLPVPSAADLESGGSRGALGEGDVGAVTMFQAAAPAEPTVDDDPVPDPELSENDLFDLVSWSMLLAPPPPDPPTPETEEGEALFAAAGCTDCHVPSLRGPQGPVPAYTDLLLHDMGDELADGVDMGVATGREFRTQPLWGVVAVAPYLHDGRADTLDEAIRWHGGEAAGARDAYAALTADEQDKILAFLESLGGADQRSEGLIAPDAPIPPVGEYGGPVAALSDAERDRFLRGRAVFDRDMFASEGVGPFFNGDSCRACHFDPVPGGAGPMGVDVSRHGIFDFEAETFTTPDQGTMAHKQALDPMRPPIDPDANVFEVRQTPPLFGLGLIDRIPEATIRSNEDPTNEDGISGRAHELPDGRVGRLGWKANVPSLAEFTRDGLSNEMGMTVPDQPGMTFGSATDDDDAPDPEMTVDQVEDLTFFMASLAPPPRTRRVPMLEDAGEALFTEVGCDGCHVPVLETADGVPVPLYSDLLLHDVAPPGAPGIEEGDATHREFRTPPLWGLARTAPYMHDGRSTTVQAAILRHDSEAAAVRDAFLELSAADRAALLAFLESL